MFIEQAYKGNQSWFRILIPLVVIGLFLGSNFIVSNEQIELMRQSMAKLPNNYNLVLALLPFVILLGILFLIVLVWHKRSLVSLTTSRNKIDFRRVLFSFSTVVFLSLISFLITYSFDSSTIVLNFNLMKFSILVVISSILFPFQIGFEEYLFRGYLMQQLGIIAKNRWFPLLFTSVLFGVLHIMNPEVTELGYGILVFYIATGFILGVLTLMDEGIELALGFHLANNIMSALLISSNYAAIQTDAIFKYTGKENSSDILFEMIFSIAIVYPIILFIFAKKYRWISWSIKLFGKLHPQN